MSINSSYRFSLPNGTEDMDDNPHGFGLFQSSALRRSTLPEDFSNAILGGLHQPRQPAQTQAQSRLLSMPIEIQRMIADRLDLRAFSNLSATCQLAHRRFRDEAIERTDTAIEEARAVARVRSMTEEELALLPDRGRLAITFDQTRRFLDELNNDRGDDAQP